MRNQSRATGRKSRKVFAMILALVMALSAFPLQALAATYAVGNAEEMASSWEQANSNSDTSNTFQMTSDIDMNGQTLQANPGKEYTVNGNGNTLSDFSVSASENIVVESWQPEVTINANLTGEGGGSDTALQAGGDVNVEVNGDVSGGGQFPLVDVYNGAEVTINGDVSNDWHGNAIVATNKSEVTVTGDVYCNSGPTIIADNSTVTVGGDVTMDVSKVCIWNAVDADNNAEVTIAGDLISGSNAALINGGSTLTVNGNIEAGVSAMTVTGSTVHVDGDISSDGQSVIQQGSDVSVGGDFVVQPNYGEVTTEGGLYVTDNSELYMADGTMLESDQIHVSGNSTLNAALVDTTQVTVGVLENNAKDTSKAYAYTNTVSSGIGRLDAAGKTETLIIGDVDTIAASQNATVEVAGSVETVSRKDNAKVIINLADKDNVQSYLPTAEGEDYQVGTTTAHTIIDLCNGYSINSTLYKQNSELLGLLADVSTDISDELNLGSAAWTSLFDHESINLSSYLSSRYTGQDFYNNVNYNAESREDFQAASDLNTYLIDVFKNNLAKSMVDLSESETKWKESIMDECELLAKIIAFTKKFEDASGAVLSDAEKKYLSNLTGSDGEISGVEMLGFLREFGYYKEGDPGAVLAAQRLSRAYEKIGPYMEKAKVAAKLAKAGVTLLDFVKHNIADYTNQLAVLDHILANQPLSPELFAAAAELRATMEDKMLGNVEKAVDLVKKESAGKIKDMYGPLAVGQAIIDIAGLITGGSKDATDLQNGAALTIVAPQLLTTFENAIENVKNGDTSEAAVQMVYMSYTMVRRTLAEMCDIMTNIGNREQEKIYEDILKKLEAMELGQVIDLPDPRK